MPNSDHYVIIGNGPAGNKTADILREKDANAKITLISDEDIPFYYKPRLTGYILGTLSQDDLMVRTHQYYKERRIRLRLGQRVTGIDPGKHRLLLGHMEEVNYTKLIIASGSRARVLPAMERYADCLSFVTAYDEVVDLKARLEGGQHFFIFGGDLVGFKFMKMLRMMDKEVTLLIYPNAFWPFNLTDEMQKAIVSRVKATGANVITQDDIDTIEAAGDQYRIDTTRGSQFTADMVFSFNGMIPRVEFARGCGLDIDRGILVNEYMETCLPDIFACGSCAQIYNPAINAYTTSIGWPNAEAQGLVAAENCMGEGRQVEMVGRKYFDLEGVKIKTTWWEDFETGSDQ